MRGETMYSMHQQALARLIQAAFIEPLLTYENNCFYTIILRFAEAREGFAHAGFNHARSIEKMHRPPAIDARSSHVAAPFERPIEQSNATLDIRPNVAATAVKIFHVGN
jgi:hypothetical protein